MPTTHLICGTVPPDSPLRRLAGRTVSLPATNLGQIAARIAEARRAGIIRPHLTRATQP